MSGRERASGRVAGIMTAVGAVGLAATWFLAGAARFWANWLLWLLFLLTVGLGALFLVALEHLADVRWSVPIRRTAERVAGLVVLAAPLAVVALLALPVLFPWTRPEAAAHPAVAGKAAWLNIPFFTVRVLLCLGLWLISYRVLVVGSIRQDRTRDPRFNVLARRFAPAFMAIYAFTVTLAAFDWISSLEPEWYSDIFGVYVFAGSFVAGLSAVALAVLHLRDRGRLAEVRFDNLYGFGGWLFAFVVFWAYIGFAQYLLQWYGNLPEEIFWYKQRVEGGWLAMVLIVGLLHFVIPFFLMIPRGAKGKPATLRRAAVLFLVAHFLDLYWLILPSAGSGPMPSWPEASFALFFGGIALLWLGRAMTIGEDLPVGDPFLAEGLEYRL
jgi:hypothetical protein